MGKVRNSGTTKTLYGITFLPSYWYEVPDDIAQQLVKKNKDFELKQGGASAPPVSHPIVEAVITEDTVDLNSMTRGELREYLTSISVSFKSSYSKGRLLDLALKYDEEE